MLENSELTKLVAGCLGVSQDKIDPETIRHFQPLFQEFFELFPKSFQALPPKDDPRFQLMLEDVFQLLTPRFQNRSAQALSKKEIQLIDAKVLSWKKILALPHSDYLNHPMMRGKDPCHPKLIKAKAILKTLIEPIAKEDGIDLEDPLSVQKAIDKLRKELKRTRPDTAEYLQLSQQAKILNDWFIIQQLKAASIPPAQPSEARSIFYRLAIKMPGATKKVAFISAETLDHKLDRLIQVSPSSLEAYVEKSHQFQLPTEAILKLPKHGDLKEVQREAIALDISRLLGLQTTRSNFLSINATPGLFIPFDSVQFLTQVSSGQSMKDMFTPESKRYTHYATINSVGEGLQPDVYFEEFGEALGLAYLCSDPDFIGKARQNKATRGGRLYVFDQVLMGSKQMDLDSRLSLFPSKTFARHTRHGKGRNRSIVEDASLESKFNALMRLKENQATINLYFAQLIAQHQQKIEELSQQIARTHSEAEANKLSPKLYRLSLLHEDAIKLKNQVKQRIDALDAIFPPIPKDFTQPELRQVMILEKLFNKPRLYTADGRAYKNPWTYRNSLKIHRITPSPERDGFFQVRFKGSLSISQLAMINRHLPETEPIQLVNSKTIELSKKTLMKLAEAMTAPELTRSFKASTTYFSLEDLKSLKPAYGAGYRTPMIKAASAYQKNLSTASSLEAQLSHLHNLELIVKKNLDKAIRKGQDQGFGIHVLKKLQFHKYDLIRQHISVHSEKTDLTRLDDAFNAALNLDRLEAFNNMLRTAVKTDRLEHLVMTQYLDLCIEMDSDIKKSDDKHSRAVHHSHNLQHISHEIQSVLTLPKSEFEALYPESETSEALGKEIAIPSLDSDPLASAIDLQAKEKATLNEIRALARSHVKLSHHPEESSPMIVVH